MAESTTTDPSRALTVTEVQAIIKKVNGYEHGNEVYPSIFVGDVHFIQNKETLKTLGITHVLNAVQGNKGHQIDTDASFYADLDVGYMGVSALDLKEFALSPYFKPAADFIYKALQDGGKVVVSCFLGVSPSFSLVLAYLMLHKALPLMEALEAVGGSRKLYPNDGFLQQLIDLDDQLRPTREKGDNSESTTTDPLTLKDVQVQVRKVNRYETHNEVYKNIYIGDEAFIRNKETLKALGITHVLNAAEGNKLFQVDTGTSFYTDVDISYMGVPASDAQDFSLATYFRSAADFIHKALQDGGKVAANCLMGYSRSATLVLAYLMVYEALPLVEAIRTMGAKRQLFPNNGFVQQLLDLENELKTTKM